ncbi:hypothetical protein ACIRPE_31350, partial [Kitasatospora aureofaciens]
MGAMNSPRYAPAGLLLRHGRSAVAFDGGPGAEPPVCLDAWLVTDEHAELRSALHRMAAEHKLVPQAGDLDLDGLAVRACPVVHTSHPAWGYRIEADGLVAVWAPEFWKFPAWADGADLMFAEASGWDRPIRFRGGVGGHMSVRDVATEAQRRGVRWLVFAHIGRPSLRAIDAGHRPPWGEWGSEGRTYTPTHVPTGRKTGERSPRRQTDCHADRDHRPCQRVTRSCSHSRPCPFRAGLRADMGHLDH